MTTTNKISDNKKIVNSVRSRFELEKYQNIELWHGVAQK